MTFVCIGDIHLEKRSVELFNTPSRYHLQVAECLKALEQVLTWCRSNGVKTVVQLGDLFDTPYPSQTTTSLLYDLLSRYADIQFITMPGNHDMVDYENHSMEVLHWMGRKEMMAVQVIMTPTLMTIDKTKCWVVPHPWVKSPPKKVDWCLGHFPWTGAKRDNGSIQGGNTKTPEGDWILADFHTYQSGPRYRYVGSLTQLSRQEQGPKGFLAVDGKETRFIALEKSYSIRTKRLEKPNQLRALEASVDGVPTYWWINIVNPDIGMPPNWSVDYPHILGYTPAPTAKIVQLDGRGQVLFTNDPLEGFDSWIVQRYPQDEHQAKHLKSIRKLARKIHKSK